MYNMKKLFSPFIIFVLLFVPICAYSAVDPSKVIEAEKYLNSITGLSGDFVQIANGKKESGIFSIFKEISSPFLLKRLRLTTLDSFPYW